VTGYWFLESPSSWKPPSELLEFLAKEPKPIYIGFGSVTVPDPDGLTKIIIDSLVKTGQRAILVKGWGGIGNIEYPDNVYAIDSVPHDWLFPQVTLYTLICINRAFSYRL
jgi:UDP:flavonoid glycosyltransferase YjiC (YdhE family)